MPNMLSYEVQAEEVACEASKYLGHKIIVEPIISTVGKLQLIPGQKAVRW